MVNRTFFEPIQLIQSSIFRDKRNEVRVTGGAHIRLPFIDGLDMFISDLLAVLENIGSGLTVFVHGLLTKFVKERVRFNELRMFINGVDGDMEKSNCPACINCVLLHVKNIRRNFLWLQGICFFVLKFILSRAFLIKHHDAQNRFRNHLKSPLLK